MPIRVIRELLSGYWRVRTVITKRRDNVAHSLHVKNDFAGVRI